MKKTTKAALAERIAENRRGNALTADEDARLLRLYLDKSGGKQSYRTLAKSEGYSVGTVMRAIKRAAAALTVVLLLSVDGWGCAGHAQDIAPTPEPDAAGFGWCCDGICGLSAIEADLFEQCFCAGAERPAPGASIGECVEGEP